MKSDHLVIVWRITENCNLSCEFCGYANALDRSRLDVPLHQVIRLGRLLRDFHLMSGRRILVSWLGGEPFTWKPLFEASHQYRHEFGLRVSVTTNGTSLKSGKTREKILEHFDEMTVSVDGMGSEHDRVRRKFGLFEQVRAGLIDLNNLKAQKSADLLLRVNTILMHNNIHNFELLCMELAAWGITEVSFNALGGGERPEFFPANQLTMGDVEWFRAELPGIRARLASKGLKILGSNMYLDRIALLAGSLPFAVQDCRPGTQYLFIDEKGMVAPCNFTLDGYGFPLEQLQTLENLTSLPGHFSRQKNARMLGPCFDCQSTHVFEKFSQPLIDLLESI